MDQPGLPAWNEFGLLPSGIHTCTLAELESRLGAFQRSDRRIQLCRRLREYLRALRKTAWNVHLLIDGSFVMSRVDEPNDIDMLLVLPPDWNRLADVLPGEYNLLSKRRVRRSFGFDVYPVLAGSSEESDWIAFFSRLSARWCDELGLPKDALKGLVRLLPE
jgi:hypothetical protein